MQNCKKWGTLQVTHGGTTEVKRARMNTSTNEFKLFIMKPGEKIQDMEKHCIHIVNHNTTLGKVFQNEDLVIMFHS